MTVTVFMSPASGRSKTFDLDEACQLDLLAALNTRRLYLRSTNASPSERRVMPNDLVMLRNELETRLTNSDRNRHGPPNGGMRHPGWERGAVPKKADADPVQPDMLTIRDVAERHRASTRWIERKIRSGELFSHKIGGLRRIPLAAYEAFCAGVEYQPDANNPDINP